MQVMHADPVLDRLVADFVRGSVDRAALDTGPGQPYRESGRSVVAACHARLPALRQRQAAELAAPDK